MKKLATKLTPAIKAWVEKELNIRLESNPMDYFHYPIGFFTDIVHLGYTEVSEQEFLEEFGKQKPIIQTRIKGGEWVDVIHQDCYRIKPTPDYTELVEALQNKAKENGMKVTINFEKEWNH